MVLLAATLAPAAAAAAPSDDRLVASFLKSVKNHSLQASEQMLSPQLLLEHAQGGTETEVMRGAYIIHLAVEDAKAGTLKRFTCAPAAGEKTECVLYRRSPIDRQLYEVSQAFFVRGGKIYKIILGSPELSRG